MLRHTARIAARILIFFICLGCATPQAQLSAPAPNPEFKKLHVLVGDWTYVGEYKAGPWGPGGQITGECRIRFILHGFVLEGRMTEKNAHGEAHFLEIDVYDTAASEIRFSEYSDADTSYSGIIRVIGQTIVRNGTVTAAEKQFAVKETLILTTDHTSATVKGELSSDKKTWLPYFEAELTNKLTEAGRAVK